VKSDACQSCGGSGYVARPVDVYDIAFIRTRCSDCGGSGQSVAESSPEGERSQNPMPGITTSFGVAPSQKP